MSISEFESKIHSLLKNVTKPYRFVGAEQGSITKDPANVELFTCIVFPDMYEVAISNLGHRILYHILNANPKILCDRAYAPSADFLQLMQANNIPLYAVDTFKPLGEFDALAFSLSYELSYPTVLKMLELSDVPVKSKERGENSPIILAGGQGAYNPEPMADFIDVFVIGDGEDSIKEVFEKILELKKQGINRKGIITALSQIEGVYVPALYSSNYDFSKPIPLDDGAPAVVKKRNAVFCDETFPVDFPVPLSPCVHDRVVVEIRRGCGRMCRFCQSCFVNLPVRERDSADIVRLVDKSLKNTGYEEYSLLSLSSNDYNGIEPLIACLNSHHSKNGISVSLPSQRADKFNINLANLVQSVRKSTITIAIEAGSQRLRDAINKNLTEEQVISGVLDAYKAGWHSVKLYFILGLPTETFEDLDETAALLSRLKYQAKELKSELNLPKHLSLTATVSIFVPKAFTPFQWCAQNSPELIKEKITYLKEKTKFLKGVRLNFHSIFLSQIEAVFARGDRSLCKFMEKLWQNGSYLDAWNENFNRDVWIRSAEESGINLDDYSCREIDTNVELPWDFIDIGVSKDFLLKEYEDSKSNKQNPACDEKCVQCGVCSGAIKKTINKNIPEINPEQKEYNFTQENAKKEVFRYRIKLTKKGKLKFISHLDFLGIIYKAVKMADLRVAYSLGFNPTPKISLAVALPLFLEGEAELADIELYEDITPEELVRRINLVLHKDSRVLKAQKLDKSSDSIDKTVHWAEYEAFVPKKNNLIKNDLEGKINHVLSSESILVEKTNKKSLKKQIEIRKSIDSIVLEKDDDFYRVKFVLRAAQGDKDGLNTPSFRADEFMKLLLGNADYQAVRLRLLDENKKSLL
ncbi:MAG: TIGR03960 family B12-binding radical SAM protein [Candidatus Gastranaerophilales bacterium]|nr:TIGR03960 family B12-binding radical SAM protein [Candidatus Gastranaerophilales bacterium]